MSVFSQGRLLQVTELTLIKIMVEKNFWIFYEILSKTKLKITNLRQKKFDKVQYKSNLSRIQKLITLSQSMGAWLFDKPVADFKFNMNTALIIS